MSAKYDPILGEIRTADESKAASAVTISGSTPTIAKVAANTVYTFSDTLSSLTITAVEDSSFPSILFFKTASTGITVTLPTTLNVTEEMSYYPNCRYALRIKNNIATLMELSSAADLAGYGSTPHNLTADDSDSRYTLASSSCGYDESYTYQLYKYYAMDSATSEDNSFSTYEESSSYWQIKFNEGFVDVYNVTVNGLTQPCILQGSFDGSTWTDITKVLTDGTYRVHATSYQYYRLKKKGESYTALGIKEIEFRYKVNTNFVYIPMASATAHTQMTSLPILAYGSGTLTYSATGLPSGLSINSSTGVVSGTFPSADFTFQLTVANSYGTSKTVSFAVTMVTADLTDQTSTLFTVTLSSAQTVATGSIGKGLTNIVWGDGGYNSETTTTAKAYSHAYAAGTYQVLVTGTYTAFSLSGSINAYVTSITKVSNSLDGSVTNVFEGCKLVTSIPVFTTTTWTSVNKMFRGCNALTNPPLINTSNVTDFGYFLADCYVLTNPPAYDTSKGTSFTYFFASCRTLVNAPVYDTSKATNMSYAFTNCYALTAAPAWDVSKVTTFQNCFWLCTSMTTLPAWTFTAAKNMSNMYYGCRAMTGTVDSASYWDNTAITSHGSCFRNCTALTNYSSIPSGWK